MRCLLVVGVLVVSGSCGDGDGDGGSEPVAVTALSSARNGAIDLAAIVLFADREGVLVESKSVDGNGQATAVLASGGEVTVIHGGGTGLAFRATVVRGVEPGDNLTIGRLRPLGDPALPASSIQVRIPPIPGESATYVIRGGCGGFAVPDPLGLTVVRIPDGCRDATVPLIVQAQVTPTDLRFLYVPAVPFVPGTTVDLVGTWKPMTVAQVHVAGVPASSVIVSRSVVLDRFGSALGASASSPTTPSGSVSVPLLVANGAGEMVYAIVGSADSESSVWAEASPHMTPKISRKIA